MSKLNIQSINVNQSIQTTLKNFQNECIYATPFSDYNLYPSNAP